MVSAAKPGIRTGFVQKMQPLIEDASKPKFHYKLKIAEKFMLENKQCLHIERQTPAQSQTRREVNATVHRNRIEAETPAQSQARRERDADAHHLVRDRQSQRIRCEAIHFIEAQVEMHNCGPMNIIC
ncbi:hypothetical protein AVEN_254328-1 [Araneus ventricosus]|uniref:Uncharacterized protein n=1 Tax=Araneus ventricosus TaxID=182803 RepID=A0A4Y2RB44_ARAVE|nr:hypothetical protein AVEN_254328-1 [Araneus ventricosus]